MGVKACGSLLLLRVSLLYHLTYSLCTASVYDGKNQSFASVPADIPLNVTELYLNNNAITALGSCQFCALTQLNKLLLNNNKIQTIEHNVFNNCPLYHLDIDRNKLTSDAIFPALKPVAETLKHLRLSRNELTAIPGGIFLNFTKLTSLRLNNNRLRESQMEESCFEGLSSLKVISLGRNDITGNVFSRIVQLSSTLEKLYLDGNDLSDADPDTFAQSISSMAALTDLGLSATNLTMVPDFYHKNENFNLQVLQLQDNPLTCDRNILWLKDVEEDPCLSTKLRMGRCAAPDRLAGKELQQLTRQDVDLSGLECETNVAIYKVLPFTWKIGDDDAVLIHATSRADVACGSSGLQLFVDTTAVTSTKPANCGQLLQECDSIGHPNTGPQGETLCDYRCHCDIPGSCRRLFLTDPHRNQNQITSEYQTTPGHENVNLVARLNISDDSITASSERPPNGYEAFRVRIDRYFDGSCSWAASDHDSAPWIQFDMGQVVVVSGVVVKKRCGVHSGQAVTSIQLEMSPDGATWDVASDALTPDYSTSDESTCWLSLLARAQYWRIRVLTWEQHPSMKADLVGKGVYDGKNGSFASVPADIPPDVAELHLEDNAITALGKCHFRALIQLDKPLLNNNIQTIVHSLQ